MKCYNIRIGTEEKPYDGNTAFAIRLNKNIVFHSSDFSESTIRPIALSLVKYNGPRIITHCPDGTRIYSFGGASFSYRGNDLVSLKIGWALFPDRELIPEIAQTEADAFCPFPISEECLHHIFGMPDTTQDHFAW
ncbi:MAG: hypothetical protein LBW77_06050 [Verrucomicrobiota bacterium]|nr:hypothetical protein [Verrucomicrobiota bacterium]